MNPNEPANKANPQSAGNFLFTDIRSHGWMYFKAILMLLAGVLASILLLIDHPSLRTGVLLAVAIWGFCRAYYFAFYVIEHYTDPTFRYSGLVSFFRHLAQKTNRNRRVTSRTC
jgi:hypothetical protein